MHYITLLSLGFPDNRLYFYGVLNRATQKIALIYSLVTTYDTSVMVAALFHYAVSYTPLSSGEVRQCSRVPKYQQQRPIPIMSWSHPGNFSIPDWVYNSPYGWFPFWCLIWSVLWYLILHTRCPVWRQAPKQ